jgi:hypothetical protein
VTTTVGRASNLFKTSFYWYELKGGGRRIIRYLFHPFLFTAYFFNRIYGAAYIPAELNGDIDFVVGISELFDLPNKGPISRSIRANIDNPVTPATLKSYLDLNDTISIFNMIRYYQIPVSDATSKKNLQAVVEFGSFFSLGALAVFYYCFAKCEILPD